MLNEYFKDTRPLVQLLFFIVISILSSVLFFFVGTIVSYFLFGIDETLSGLTYVYASAPLLRFFQMVSQIGLFIIPSYLFSKIFYGSFSSYFGFGFKESNPLLVIFFIVLMPAAFPLIEWLSYLNQQISFPESLKSLELFFRGISKSSDLYLQKLLEESTPFSLIGDVFVICLFPILSEELFFRGVIQKISIRWIKKNHLSVILVAAVFSMIHMDFYDLLPRFALGLILGYSYFYTKSITVPIIMHFINNAGSLSQYVYGGGIYVFKGISKETIVILIVSILIVIDLIHSIRDVLKSSSK